jgi:hypothetical protein
MWEDFLGGLSPTPRSGSVLRYKGKISGEYLGCGGPGARALR